MRTLAIWLILSGTVVAQDLIYEGTWVTTKNRKLDGTMTCVVIDNGKDTWHGRFFGVWQGVKFSYDVDWSGPPEKLVGKATIDGAKYDWTGTVTPGSPGQFKGTFDSGRYTGSFDLKQKIPK